MADRGTVDASRRIVEETKRLYGTLLPSGSKPLEEKQLARPTFKFIQDLVKRLMTDTKILRDVFNAKDFVNQRADKKFKVEFVQKLIDYAANNRQPVASCLAAKVVAGLEPNKTNELLQSLARIAQQKLSKSVAAKADKRPRTFTRHHQPPASGPDSAASSRRSSSVAQSGSRQPSAGKPDTRDDGSPLASATVADNHLAPAQPKISQVLKQPEVGNEKTRETNSPKSLVSGSSQRRKQQSTGQDQKQQPVAQQLQLQSQIQVSIVSESDIARGIQFVRANLTSLSEVTESLKQTELAIREYLIKAQ